MEIFGDKSGVSLTEAVDMVISEKDINMGWGRTDRQFTILFQIKSNTNYLIKQVEN